LKTVVIVSDLHVGSIYGIMPPSVERADGLTISPGKAQKALYDAWKHISEKWNAPDLLIVNGDAIDGPSPASLYETWCSDVSEQVEAAYELLEMWNANAYRFTVGSGYHVSSKNLKYEQTLANLFGTRAEQQLSIEVGDKRMHVAHEIGVSGSPMYRTTALARELAFLKLNQSYLSDYDWTIRSHAHYYVHVEYKSHHGLITPCWQIQTPYMVKRSPFGMIPDIGALRITIGREADRLEKFFVRAKTQKPEKIA